ncbi:MAG: ABC transporter ATP-binding protein [Paracoccus sp. (in: a-proteobacteria)]|nr:ABC transporter ATP-binding protein [Paracoccus sp. (in: a-proteobacteria)]
MTATTRFQQAPAETPMLEISHASRRFAATPAVQDLTLSVAPGRMTCLLGPSGCGKSTTLRLISGIERPDAGEIRIDGQVMANAAICLPPEKRPVGMVFQDLALFPHMTVAQNIAFGMARAERSPARIDDFLDRVGLPGYGAKYPHMLSGGEQQRVALSRAIAARPKVMLLDEPFSSLDQRLRAEMRAFTLDLLRESETTVIMVTHDPDEAMIMADRIAVMDRGHILQEGTPLDLYHRPTGLAVAQFLADLNLLPGVAANGRIDTALGPIPAAAANALPDGTRLSCAIRPEHLRLQFGPANGAGHLARVLRIQSLGRESIIEFSLPGVAHRLRSAAPGPCFLAPGDMVGLEFNPHSVMLFSETDGARIG